MDIANSALWTAAAATASVCAALALFGLARKRLYGGWRVWLVGLVACTAGMALAAAAQEWASPRWLTVPAEWGLLQWPIACLIGVRLFHNRMHLPGRLQVDAGVAAAAATLVVAGAFTAPDGGLAALAPAAASLAVHLYAASLLMCGPADREGQRLRWLGAVFAVSALLPVLLTLPLVAALPTLTHRAMAALLTSVATAFVIAMLITDRTERQLRDSRRRLRMLANIDSLTNVPNRRHFHELASRVLASDPPGSAAMVIFDVDHFKGINDQLGHAAGDRALRLVARSLQEVLRTNDVPGRHGGDEFVLLVRRATNDDAMVVAQRIVARVQALSRDSGLPRLSMSFGIVHMRRDETVDDALRRADQALYEAKRQGRSRAVMADGDEHTPVFTDSQPLGLRAA